MRKWLAGLLLRAYLALSGGRRDVRLPSQRLAVLLPDGGPPLVIDPEAGRPVPAPEGCSFHIAVGGDAAHLALAVDDPAARAVLVYGGVDLLRPAPQTAEV